MNEFIVNLSNKLYLNIRVETKMLGIDWMWLKCVNTQFVLSNLKYIKNCMLNFNRPIMNIYENQTIKLQ